MIKYDKLIRDNIPEILKSKNIKFEIHNITDDNEYLIYLYNKLNEEINEFKQNPSIEEFADMMEVLDYIAKYYKIDLKKTKIIKKKKKILRGGFDKKIILKYTK